MQNISKSKKLGRVLTATLLVVAMLVSAFAISGCGEENKSSKSSKKSTTSQTSGSTEDETTYSGEKIKAVIDIKDYGKISLDLYKDAAPITVENFVSLAKDGFYDGLTFHRIIKNFMIQGGDPKGNGTGGSEKEIKGEFSANGVTNNLHHTRGAISMARSQAMDSASSQFFIVQKTKSHLDGQYAAFGYVTDGMDIVDKICDDTTVQDNNGTVAKANQPVINSIKILDSTDSEKATEATEASSKKKSLSENKTAVIKIEGYDDIEMVLYAKEAPNTVNHFTKLVNSGYYNGKSIYCLVKQNNMKFGNGDETDASVETVKSESDNKLSHTKGAVSMLHPKNDKDGATTDFFITLTNNSEQAQSLDGNYTVFAYVVADGMDVIDQIQKDTKVQDSKGTIAKADQPIIKSITTKD